MRKSSIAVLSGAISRILFPRCFVRSAVCISDILRVVDAGCVRGGEGGGVHVLGP